MVRFDLRDEFVNVQVVVYVTQVAPYIPRLRLIHDTRRRACWEKPLRALRILLFVRF